MERLMNNIRLIFLYIFGFVSIINMAYAQPQGSDSLEKALQQKKFPKHNLEMVKQLAVEKSREWQQKRSEAEKLARKYNIPIRVRLKDGRVMELQRFKRGKPVYLITYNRVAAETISTDEVWNGPYFLDGSSETLGIWDGGAVRATHNEFTGRVTQRDGATILNDHATHVAGTMIAKGNDYNAIGMANDAYLDAYDWNDDYSEMLNAWIDLHVSNHSYGYLVGWDWNDAAWYWHGDYTISETEDYQFGFYDEVSRDLDDLVQFYRPYHLPVIAVGNDRNDQGPGPGGFHYIEVNGQWVGSNTTRDPDGGTLGYDCIPGGYAVAKNVLTVGAVEDIPGGYWGTPSVVVTDFTSWGPTDDGRIKPDVVANGSELYSSWHTDDYAYMQNGMSGTSMATPNVSGSIALLLQRFDELYPLEGILASTLKALIIHTSDEAGNPGPDYQNGWGLMNTQNAVELINLDNQDGHGSHLAVYTFQGQPIDLTITPTQSGPLEVTICWSDPSGTPPFPWVDPPDIMLVNDLDLTLLASGGGNFYPYVLDPASPTQPATTGDNDRDNVEKVVIVSPSSNQYTARINLEGVLQGNQDFSIIVTGGYIGAPAPVTYNITVENSFTGGQIIVDGQTYNSGGTFPWQANSQHTLEAFDQDWPAPNNYFRVFQNQWKKDEAFYSSNNPITITVTEDATFKAVFKKRFDFEVDNNFVDGGSGGNIKLNGQTQPAPYFQTLIEGENIVVEAPTQTQTVNGKQITYNFLKWSDGGAGNPRTFDPNDHTDITADYKGHLISLTPNSTSGNNSRKIAVDAVGNWHQVYEDNGQIYYTRSTDNGNTWEAEELVSGRYTQNSYPAITVEPVSPHRISVVWNMDFGIFHYFNWRTKPAAGSWGAEFSTEDIWVFGGSSPTKPAAIRRGDLYIVAKLGGGLGLYRFDDSQLVLLGQLPETDDNSQNVTITASAYYASGILHLAWEQVNQIYYTSFDIGTNNFSDPEEVTLASAGIEINQSPSIAYGLDNMINVTWSGFDVNFNAYVLLHRQRSSSWNGQWNALNELYYSYYDITSPSIGSFIDPSYNGWFNVAFQFGNGSDYMRVIQYDSGKWKFLPYWIPGSHPSLNVQGDDLMLTGTDNTAGSPYPITSQYLTPEEEGSENLKTPPVYTTRENNPPGERLKIYHKEIFRLAGLPAVKMRGKVQVSLGDLHIQTADSAIAWRFSALRDSTLKSIFMQTEPLIVSGDMQTLMLYYRARVKELKKPARFPNLPLFRLRLLDESAGHPLMVVKQVSLNDLSGSQFNEEDSLAIDLQPFMGQKIVLQMQTVHHILSGKNQKPERVNRYEFYGNSSHLAMQSFGNQQEVSLAIPEEFALSQNYPNPFNPTTTISISLPEDGAVQLHIYDITGRKVRKLLDKPLPAGVHQVVWDGRNGSGGLASSGIYVYRVLVSAPLAKSPLSGGKAGEFVQSRKMVLMR